MNATTSAVARIAGVAIVLILAAALGLIAGNALNARVDVGAAAGESLPHMGGFDGARYDSPQHRAATVGTPAYADPYRQHIEGGQSDAAPVVPQTWGNVDERHDARSSDEPPAGQSLTAPTPR